MEVKQTPAEKAAHFKAKCAELGATYSARDTVVTVMKRFTPGDVAAYSDAESDCYTLLALVPNSGGSMWGTDSGSIGGHVGCTGGYCKINRSGVKKRFTAALLK